MTVEIDMTTARRLFEAATAGIEDKAHYINGGYAGRDGVEDVHKRALERWRQALKHIVDPTGWPGRPYGEHPTLIERGYNFRQHTWQELVDWLDASDVIERLNGLVEWGEDGDARLVDWD